ncbi:MAG: hypothetical protein Q7J09_07655 [Methanocalculus sp.]|nr:hypothetical protein [Methanocalculus sp.]MDO9539860.1 hypothetical protein [Methanocalculus sp.]
MGCRGGGWESLAPASGGAFYADAGMAVEQLFEGKNYAIRG